MADELVLRPKRRWALLLLAGTLFVGGSAIPLLVDEGPLRWLGWFLLLTGALGVLLTLLLLVDGSPEVRLDRGGFTLRMWFRKDRIRWDEVSHCGVGGSRWEYVVFDFVRDHPRRRRGGRWSVDGHDAAIFAVYGMKADEMALLMNSWRRVCTESPETGSRT